MYSYSYLTAIDSCIVALKRNKSNHKSRLEVFVWLAPFAPALIVEWECWAGTLSATLRLGNADFT